jgi:hypothetical protein
VERLSKSQQNKYKTLLKQVNLVLISTSHPSWSKHVVKDYQPSVKLWDNGIIDDRQLEDFS